MSELADLMEDGMAALQEVAGVKSFTITGVDGTFTGDLDSFAVESEDLRKDGGGLLSETKAVIVALVAQFSGVENLDKTLPKKRLTIAGRVWKIVAAETDDTFITLQLDNPEK